MIGLTPEVRAQRIADLSDAIKIIHPLVMASGLEPMRTLIHATRYLSGQREVYRCNALCEHCGKDIVFRDYEYWIHEEGEIMCDTDEEHEAEPAEVKKTEIWRAA